MQKIYQVDAFADFLFSGNPAAVCPLEHWLPDSLLQNIAAENNLAETAFYVKKDQYYELRWFTPTTEVDLCGHATLAAAFVLFSEEGYCGSSICFKTRSGDLTVSRNNSLLTLDFPADEVKQIPLSAEVSDCFNIKPLEAFRGRSDLLLLFESEAQIRNLMPRFHQISMLDARGVIATASGETVDFVSRFFAPNVGVPEDPVTGSAHTTLLPYWSRILGKDELTARQLSSRGGSLQGRIRGNRVEISGAAQLYLRGTIFLPADTL